MGNIVGSVLSLGGGLISGSKAADAAKGQAEALRAAGNLSYDRSKFNPIGIKTNLGSSNFTMGPDGQLTSAGYSLSPELQAIQQRVIGGAGQYDPYQITTWLNLCSVELIKLLEWVSNIYLHLLSKLVKTTSIHKELL
jgi:hypothetical protein